MAKYIVTATVRVNHCDRNSAIEKLRLDQPYNGWAIHALADLVELANQHLLWVNLGYGAQPARVEIFWSERHRRFVARTTADTTLVNNLENLPILKPAGYQSTAGAVTYESCSL